jgi:hypothetical protein
MPNSGRTRNALRWVRVGVVLGLLTGGLFLFRWYKNHAVEESALENITWLREAVIRPNSLRVSFAGGGGPNWFGFGRFTIFVETRVPKGPEATFFFDMDSMALGVRTVKVLMAVRASALDLRNYRPKELADVMSTPKPDPVDIETAKRLTKEEWLSLAAGDPMGIVRVRISPDQLRSQAPIILREVMPGFFSPPAPATAPATQQFDEPKDGRSTLPTAE